jgi:4-amino-4-deoxy-L-arabinose transferase-like glycosyltransferase
MLFIPSFRDSRWFYVFLCVHLILWTLVPILVRNNLPLDSIEGSIWGHQLEWGYDKNPFLNGWLTALAAYLGGQSGWMIYFFSQISVVVCFWAVWKLAKNMLPPAYALIAVMLLEGVQYYNFHAIDFNDNTLELSLWALTIYFFYQALCTKSKSAWLLTGLFAAFGMMAKYYTATLLTAMVLFFFRYAENRKQLKTLSPYLSLIVFLAIILPHVIWLFFHDFITVAYVFQRASSAPHWANRFFYPAQFTFQQLQVFLPAIILFVLLLLNKKNPKQMTAEDGVSRTKPERLLPLTSFNRSFLFYMGFGPFLLTLFISLVFSTKLRAGWGMPLLSLWGIALIALVQPSLTKVKILRFITSIFILMGGLVSVYSLSLIYSKSESSANFPGQEIAHTLTQEWHDKFHTKLAYVAGSRWVGGNVSFYSADHPAVFIEWDHHRAPWIDINTLKQTGALFIWNISENETLPETIQKRFPTLLPAKALEFAWLRNKNHLTPIKIGIAYLPPQTNGVSPTEPELLR